MPQLQDEVTQFALRFLRSNLDEDVVERLKALPGADVLLYKDDTDWEMYLNTLIE